MKKKYDAIVIGLGIVGSSILYHLAKSGKKVLGIDQFNPPHHYGSSHGETRIIREAPFEGDTYYQLALKAFPEWLKLENEAQKKLYYPVGGLDVGHPGEPHIEAALSICKEYDLDYQYYTAKEVNKKYPAFHLPDDVDALFMRKSGFVLAEETWQAFLDLAKHYGADILCNQKVEAVDENAHSVTVHTSVGQYEAEQSFISNGSWIKKLYPEFERNITILRQVLAWFETETIEPFLPENLPIFAMTIRNQCLYGFPSIQNNEVKLACHHHFREETDPDHVNQVNNKDLDYLHEAFTKYFPSLKKILRATTCKYTYVDDDLFIIDRPTGSNRQIIFSCCSGHGFKYAPIFGDMAMDYAYEGQSRYDWPTFSKSRFKK